MHEIDFGPEEHPNAPGNGQTGRPYDPQVEAEIDRIEALERDENPTELRWRAPDLAALITENNALPWIALRVGADKAEIARARAKSMIMLMAPQGAGKSSLALELAWRHALDVGPAVYVSLELDADEAGGRVVGQRCGAGWEDALRCRIPAAHMVEALAIPRLVILATDDATPAKLERAVATLGGEHPGQPVLAVIDYLQLLHVEGVAKDERQRVSTATEYLRRLAQRLRCVMVVISQASRASSAQLKDGELLGADTAATGAETAQIERAGALTIALGGMRPLEDGTTHVDLSIGKGRMGQGDRVFGAVYDGKTGAWRITSDSRPASEVRTERASEKDRAKVARAADAIAGNLAAAPEPRSANALRADLHIARSTAYAAIEALMVEDPRRVVRVKGRRVGGAWPLWTPSRAGDAGVDLVPDGV